MSLFVSIIATIFRCNWGAAMRYLPLMLLCLTGLVHAGIYKTYDKNGNAVFSDAPSNDAQEVVEKPVMVVPALPKTIIDLKTQPLGKNTSATEPTDYKITIANIKANDTLRKEDKSFMAGVTLEPALWKEHHLQLSLDGKQIGKDAFSVLIDPSVLERGQHRLEIVVVTNKKKILKTEVVDFFIQQSSVANKK